MFRKMVPFSSSTLWYGMPVAEGDYPVIRYAEILLTFAEAHLHTTGYDQEVRDALNKLRDRCGMPDVPVSLSKDDAVEFVRNERRIELAGEGHRYFDIRRYGKDYAIRARIRPDFEKQKDFISFSSARPQGKPAGHFLYPVGRIYDDVGARKEIGRAHV